MVAISLFPSYNSSPDERQEPHDTEALQSKMDSLTVHLQQAGANSDGLKAGPFQN
jgi:hypothetical protein